MPTRPTAGKEVAGAAQAAQAACSLRGGHIQGFIQDFSKRGGNHLTPPTYQETVPITNVLTARIHLWKKL